MALRWGIASAGKISHDFATAVATLPAADHKIVAVAARNQKNAQEFADLHDIERAYEGYVQLAQDENVEVVYVGTLNPQHYEVVLLMLENNKHVLCEKPLCMNQRQAAHVLRVAKERKLFLMEAIWSRFFPAYTYLSEQVKSGALGEIQEVSVGFGFPIAEVARLAQKSLGGGTVLDLGVYVIQVSQWVFDSKPLSIKATGKLNEDGCDVEMEAELTYSNGGVAKIRTSAVEELSNKAVVRGTKGTITVNDFWSPTSVITVDGTEKQWTLPKGKHAFNFKNSAGLSYEAEEVRRCIRAGLTESSSVTHDNSLTIAHIEDTIRQQIGVEYPCDA